MSENVSDPRFYALRNAVYSDREAARNLILDDPTAIDARNSIGETALHDLAVENDLDGVRWLVAQGCDVNTRNSFGATPLIEAAALNYVDLCRFLLANGADVFARDENDSSAFFAASCDRTGDDTEMLRLLLEHLDGAELNDVFDEMDAHHAFTYASPAIVGLLLSRGLKDPIEGAGLMGNQP